ncbi:hypothetical protein AJ90_22760 [Vibrio parahaemolyticus M0605]|nr:hypothetical protein AJ90_22760 [Vibrio parahaemolyticus M0605]
MNTPVQGLTSGGQSLTLVEISNSGGVSVYEALLMEQQHLHSE